MMQDDDANSDSGLEPESPIARRKLFNISSVKHTGKYNVLFTRITYVASIPYYQESIIEKVSCCKTAVFRSQWKKRSVNFTL